MASPSLQQARSHHARQAAIAASAVMAVRRLMKARRSLAEILATIASYQFASATTASASIATATGGARPVTNPVLFAGVSSAGFPISEPLIATIDRYVPAPPEALPEVWWDDVESFMAAVEQLVESEVQDAGRSAAQVELNAAPDWQNYVRVLVPPSCKRCVVLAGRIYRDLEGFERHPKCFPAGVTVSGPASRAATRRWYEGELVVLRTASGEELPITGNHPVLTDKGWVPANLLQVGDHVVHSTSTQGALPLVVPDEQQAPALIEDVRGSDGMVPFGVVPTSAEDFHGDGGHGEVDIVFANSLLWNRLYAPASEFSHEKQLSGRVAQPLEFATRSAREQLLLGMAGASSRLMRSGGLGGAFVGGHAPGADLSSLGHVSQLNALDQQALANCVAGNPVADAERVLAFASAVRRRNVGTRQVLDSPRWDAPAGSLAAENLEGYVSRGLDLLPRLASQVTLDRIVKLERVSFRGHVYNLTSAEGWFSANGLIVSNCDCVHWPAQDWEEAHDAGLVSSPQEAFDKGMIRDLTAAETKAILDGADITTVINSSRGIRTADLFGRRVKVTTYGTTKRSAWRKANPTLLVRLRPESIYRIAGGDHAEALRLLRLYGYIT